MSESDRSDFFKSLGIGALLVGMCALLIWALSQKSDWYQQSATDRSYAYTDNAKAEIANRCAPMAPADEAKCMGEAKQSARANQREEQDLAAQKISAWWTKIMGAAAIVGMALSAVGVFLVYTTFSETKRANEISGDTAKQQLRPWLGYTGHNINPVQRAIREDGTVMAEGWAVSVSLKNTGVSPAIKSNVKVTARVDRPRNVPDFALNDDPATAVAIIAPDRPTQSHQALIEQADVARIIADEVSLFVHCACFYESTAEPGVRRVTETTLEIEHGYVRGPQGQMLDHFSATHVGPQNRMT